MLVTLALVVVASAIIVFFADEFINLFKRFFEIKGTKLFVPLLVASWLVYGFMDWFLWALLYFCEVLHAIVHLLIKIIPFTQVAKPIALILTITAVSVIPVLVADLIVRRKRYKGLDYVHFTSFILFIVSSMLLLAL